MEEEISSFLAPWFKRGWISLLAKTPQREAIVYRLLLSFAISFITFGVTPISCAIWSMKEPVPPAQVPFILTSTAPVKKRILASSPPSSITTSVSFSFFSTANLVAKTSCTKGTFKASATPIPAEPEKAVIISSSSGNCALILDNNSDSLRLILDWWRS